MDIDLTDAIGAYKDASEEELMETLCTMTAKERANGSLDNTKLDEIYEMLYPYLTDAQRAKMEQVLTRLKE